MWCTIVKRKEGEEEGGEERGVQGEEGQTDRWAMAIDRPLAPS